MAVLGITGGSVRLFVKLVAQTRRIPRGNEGRIVGDAVVETGPMAGTAGQSVVADVRWTPRHDHTVGSANGQPGTPWKAPEIRSRWRVTGWG